MTATATTRSVLYTRADEYRTDFLSDHAFMWPRSSSSPRTKTKYRRTTSIGSPTSSKRNALESELRKSKSVHFADSKGLALVSVLTFNAEKELRDELDELSVCRNERWTRTRSKPDNSVYAKAKETLFVSSKKLAKKVEAQKVCLEKTEMLECAVRGIVCVHNLSYEKTVLARYTLDEWRNGFEDVQAEFNSHSHVYDMDRFVFEIPLPNDVTSPAKNFKVEFAICYKVLGDSYWDNNNGFNYHVLFTRG